MRKLYCILLVVLLCLPAFALGEENLLKNADFESVEAGLPADWYEDAYYASKEVSSFALESGGASGNCIRVTNATENDARFMQTVSVEPNTVYKITCLCRAEGIPEGSIGATISIKDTFSYSESLTDTAGEWVPLTLYGQTGADQTAMTVYARVGGYGYLNTGTAWFDSFEMVKADTVPADATVTSFATRSSSSSQQKSAFTAESDAEPSRNTEAYVLLTALYALAVISVARKYRRSPQKSDRFYLNILVVALAAAFALRAALAVRVRGYYSDINCFSSWADTMFSVGPRAFYSGAVWCDYPPGYMLMLWPVGAVRALLRGVGLNGDAIQLLCLKLPAIAFDLLASILVYRRGKRRLGARAGMLLSLFYAFNPAAIIDSAAWGQIDAIFTLLIALCALDADEKRYCRALIAFGCAALIKPQALLFAPLGLFAILQAQIRDSEKPAASLYWLLSGAAAALLAAASLSMAAGAAGWLLLAGSVLFSAAALTLFGKSALPSPCAIVPAASLLGGALLGLIHQSAAIAKALAVLSILELAVMIALLVIYAISCTHESGKSLRSLLRGLAIALGGVYLLALLLRADASQSLTQNLIAPVEWLKELYSGTMQGYSYVTVNALNLYHLLDLNWKRTDAHTAITTVAWILFALSYLYSFAVCALSKAKKALPLIGGMLIVLICTFGPMIHERYVFPALLLLAIGYAQVRDRRVLGALIALSCTLFLNQFLVLQGGMTRANYGHLQSSEAWINLIVAFANVAIAFFLAWTVADICLLGNTWRPRLARKAIMTWGRNELLATGRNQLYSMHFGRKDALLIAIVTILYSILAFTNLGATKAPQTSWVSQEAGDSVTFDLGETRRFRMTYYGGVCNTNFTVSLSNDGLEWTAPYYANYDQGEIFRWLRYTPLDENGKTVMQSTEPRDDGGAYTAFSGYEGESAPFQRARYVRISAVAPGLTLSEIAFQDENGKTYPVQIASAAHDGEALIDEQDAVPAYPSYYNSTYFDEIYHARTAYEHLHGMSTYEWTHPPLGKVLMMVGIQLFGMTPFGWRFMGALMGVLMLPVMYLLTDQLTHSRKLSFLAMFLLAVDSMHFTQTRIATIDSYAVFWIMLMYFFMIRYFQMNWTNWRDFGKSLVPLGLCGITMGVAWATKWIGLYASAGLAALFFWALFRRMRRYFASRREKDRKWFAYMDDYPKYAAITILFCLIFFVVIPVLIYYFSYYWHLRGEGLSSFGDMLSLRYVRKVIELQQRIFKYHAGLSGDTHYFRSPWYQWPVIWWPMWYYSGTAYLPTSGMISSISCMGNPAVWWFGLVALIYILIRAAWQRFGVEKYAIVLIGFASQFLPWVLVPRSTFIYHYFASVPFIILASVLMLDRLRPGSSLFEQDQRPKWLFPAAAGVLCGMALMLFIAFYPLESGLPVARWYAQLLRWFKWYNF